MKHLRDKNLGYFQHMRRAFRLSVTMAKLSGIYYIAAVRYAIHGTYPDVFAGSTAVWISKRTEKIWNNFKGALDR